MIAKVIQKLGERKVEGEKRKEGGLGGKCIMYVPTYVSY
jgi:hypothetical protein